LLARQRKTDRINVFLGEAIDQQLRREFVRKRGEFDEFGRIVRHRRNSFQLNA
jgi:hypothetical protein